MIRELKCLRYNLLNCRKKYLSINEIKELIDSDHEFPIVLSFSNKREYIVKSNCVFRSNNKRRLNIK